MEIMEVNEKIRRTEEDLLNCKEALQNKVDSLLLYADWKNLKETKGISNQPQRDAHIREITATQRRQTKELEITLEYLKRRYYELLYAQKTTSN